MKTNPYKRYVAKFERQLREGKTLPLGGMSGRRGPVLKTSAPKVLLFSPHPDDECIVGGLPLRLRRELRMNVINVVVTQGSDKTRQAARLEELRQACAFLGFGVMTTREGGLEKINVKTRNVDSVFWKESVDVIARLLAEHRPGIIFMPHVQDWNSTHIGTHFLVKDALQQMESGFTCLVIETEFWAAMTNPNVMVESNCDDVAALAAAISFHAGEVVRNPYHLRLPAWMSDNVRRGGELVVGQGGAAPDYAFATLYRISRFGRGTMQPAYEEGKRCAASDDLGVLFR